MESSTPTTPTTTNPNTPSTKLYGRNAETILLRKTYNDNSIINRSSPLVVVSGPTGIGKRSLAGTLIPHIQEQDGGLFVSGQFHSTQHDKSTGKALSSRPLGAICQALESIWLIKDEEKKNDTFWTKSMAQEQFTDRGDRETLIDLLPCAAQWFENNKNENNKDNIDDDNNDPAKATKTMTLDATTKPKASTTTTRSSSLPLFGQSAVAVGNMPLVQQKCAVLVRLISALVATSQRPLVMLLEQLEHANQTDIDFIEQLLLSLNENKNNINNEQNDDPRPRQLMLIATLNNNDGITALPDVVATYISKVTAQRRIVSIPLTPLSWDSIFHWISAHPLMMNRQNNRNDDIIHEMTDLALEQSAGNPEFIRFWLLYVSLCSNNEDDLDDKFLEELRRTGFVTTTTTTTDLFVQILAKVTSDIRDVVQLVAAIIECGQYTVDAGILEIVQRKSCTDATMAAVEMRLLEVVVDSDDNHNKQQQLRFRRIELQSAAYQSISVDKRASYHLRIGRRIWKHPLLSSTIPPQTSDPSVLLDIVARNLHQGVHEVIEIDQRDAIVLIQIQAGKHAMMHSNFTAAASYFEYARATLGDRIWTQECYDMSLLVCNCASEAYYCMADFDGLSTMLDAVLQHAKNFHDKLQAYTTSVYANGARSNVKEALRAANEVLRHVGEPFPSNPGKLTFLREYLKTEKMLAKKPNRFFLNLPLATNEDKIVAMQILNFTMIYAYIVNPYAGILACLRTLQLILKYGIAAPAIQAFAGLGYVKCFYLGQWDEGIRYGELALALLEQIQAGKYYVPRTYVLVYAQINRWASPVEKCLEPLQQAARSALRTGDMEGWGRTVYYYIELSFLAGKPLRPLEQEARTYCGMLDQFKQTLLLVYLVPLWSTICDVVGGTPLAPLRLADAVSDADSALNCALDSGDNHAVKQYYYFHAIASCYNEEFHATLSMAAKSRKASPDANVWLSFFEGLAALATARTVHVIKRRKYLSIGRQAVKFLKARAKTCPANFVNKQILLEAELASLEGGTLKALVGYTESIKLAKSFGLVHEEGLGYERLALFHKHLNNKVAAAPFFESARDAYDRWGAQSLVQRMERHIAEC